MVTFGTGQGPKGLKMLFDEIDSDGGGTLSTSELRDGLRARASELGLPSTVSDARYDELFSKLDADGGGTLTIVEVVKGCRDVAEADHGSVRTDLDHDLRELVG